MATEIPKYLKIPVYGKSVSTHEEHEISIYSGFGWKLIFEIQKIWTYRHMRSIPRNGSTLNILSEE